MPKPDDAPAGLSGLDWLVIVAATVALIVLVVWLVQGGPPRPAVDEAGQ